MPYGNNLRLRDPHQIDSSALVVSAMGCGPNLAATKIYLFKY